MAERRGGRPKGLPKTGGKQKGSLNKATLARAQAMAQALVAEALTPEQQAELTPLAALLRIMRAELQAGDHAAAKVTASLAAPYCHAKLSSSDVRITGTLDTKSDEDIAAEIAAVRAKLAAATKVVLN
jgi:hypothetical protein